jgi:signal transduction histidine kinase
LTITSWGTKLAKLISEGTNKKHLVILLMLSLILAIFTVELVIMVSLHRFLPSLPSFVVGLIDGVLLILLLFPLLYLLVFQPLMSILNEREMADKKLRSAYAEMEKRVEERTKDLTLANEKLKKHSRKLEDANRLKDLFTDIMRHDLLNPAGVVSGAADVMMESTPDNKELQIINRNIKRLIDIIDNASKLSKLESQEELEKKELDLKEVLDTVIRDNEQLFEFMGIKIVNRVKRKHMIRANPMLEDLFQNLLSNAAKHAAEGKRAVIDLEDMGKSYRVSVEDYGPGVPDKYKEDIFVRFKRRSKGGVKGTGLGLAISKRIVKLHKGRIWVEDNPEGGSIFLVEIPK